MQTVNFEVGGPGWAMDAAGNVEFNSGYFRGDLSGATGTFSGALSASSIHIPDEVAAGSLHVNSTGQMWWGNSGSYAAATNKIDNTGTAILTAGAFTGAISAATIDIGVSTALHVDVDGRIWSGHADYASAPFKVAANGDAVFASVQITGGTLAVGNSGDANEKFFVGAGGEHWAGHETYGSAPFSISRQGALVATSATITGAITATTGTFGTTATGHFEIDGVNGNIQMFSGVTNRGYIDIASGTYGDGLLLSSGTGTTAEYGGAATTRPQIILAPTKLYLSGGANDIILGGLVATGSSGQGNDIYIQALNSVKFYDGTQKIAELTGGSTVGTFQLFSDHISEGGELILGQAEHANFTKNVYIDNASDQMRIHDGGTVKFLIEMRGDVAGDGKVDGRVRVYGRGIAYDGTMAGGGSRNDMGFSWSSPNIYGHVDGAVAAIIGVVSDRRLKEDIQPVVGSDSLAKVMAYRPITYLPLGLDGESDPEAERHTGMIADEVELIDSSLVSGEADDPDQFQSVYYAGVIPDLLQAFQDIVGRVDTLESA